jgi:hypothetical protein
MQEISKTDETKYDQSTIDRLKSLIQAKNRAINMED